MSVNAVFKKVTKTKLFIKLQPKSLTLFTQE